MTLQARFERQAALHPDAVAVRSAGELLTYRQLDRAANGVAHRLHQGGAAKGDLVGLHVEHSPQLVVALLGILKAGAACLPLDPEHPAQRIASIVESADVRIILTGSGLRRGLPQSPAEIWSLDNNLISNGFEEPPAVNISGDDLACVFYTSGSTGVPKGVVQTHSDCLYGQMGAEPYYELSASDRIPLKATLATSGLICEIFWPLVNGGSIVVVRPGGHRDSRYLVDLFARERVTLVHVVPTLLRLLLEEPGLNQCTGLRHVACAGEPLSVVRQDLFFASLPGVRLSVIYGCTEVPSATFRWCAPGEKPGAVNIGKPVGEKRAFVLDSNLRAVPAGSAGELYFGGPGLARGYLNQPELTSERYVTNPNGDGAYSRIYRTGDLVRSNADGTIEYLGRIDHQIQVRGYRVEPGEIEAALESHQSVGQAVVILVPEPNREPALTAFVTSAGAEAPRAADLDAHLRGRLPDYMTPARYSVLDSFPTLPNGKVDREALKASPPSAPARETPIVPPGNECEAALATIWQAEFNSDAIGIEDSFFDLGGDSVTAARIVNRIRNMIPCEIGPTDLLRYSTIRALAAVLEGRRLETSNLRSKNVPGTEPRNSTTTRS